MKTPNELKKIYNRLPKDKTELGNHKVELGFIDDAKQILSNVKNSKQILSDVELASKQASKEYVNLKIRIEKVKDTFKTVIGAESDINKIEKISSKGDKVLKDIQKGANALGVKPTEIKEYNQLFDAVFDLAEESNKARKFVNEIKSLNNELK
jgi:hypothetical protein